MVLGISEDFSSKIVLDSQLKTLPSSGLFLNSGVHPSVTVGNLLDFLPKTVFTFADWENDSGYGVFLTTRDRKDIVKSGDKIYQSIKTPNLNQAIPSDGSNDYWQETNIESLRIKMFIEQVKDKVYSDLYLTKRLVNNQFLYDDGNLLKTLPNDYSAWVIEPRGSDYVSFKINQISIQANGTDPINVYIVNQNRLLETITVTPNNGQISFNDVDVSLSGKGDFKIVIASQDVYVGNASVNPLKFDGFVAYFANGIGNAPEEAKYTFNTYGNGIGLNISAFLDASQYIDDNLIFLSNYIRATFTYMVFELFLHNSNNRTNRSQRIQMNDDILIAELKDMKADTVVRKYHREKKRAIVSMEKTFDTQLNDHDGFEISTSTY